MKLTVSIITYNHVKFIAQAIESALMQQTDFDFEILIGEDGSNDGTQEIVKQYEAKYPDKIRVFYHSYPPDYKRINGRSNFLNNIKNAKGKYISLLEGDDYWTNTHKLQKQVDFLEANPDFAICFHNAELVYEMKQKDSHLSNIDQAPVTTVEDLCKRNYIMTATCIFRNYLYPELPKWFEKVPAGDWALHMINATYGKIGYLDEAMSVYRIHEKSIWSSKKAIWQYERILIIINTFIKYLPSHYKTILKESLSAHRKHLVSLYLQELRLPYKDKAKKQLWRYYLRYLQLDKPSSKREFIFAAKTFKSIIKASIQ